MSSNKKLSQKDLRELMRQRKSVLSQSITKIESPLAKYDDNGLCCVLCNVRIENQTQDKWSDHITGVMHKNKLEQLKRKKQLQTQSSDDNTANRLTCNQTLKSQIKSASKRKSDSVNNENNVLSSKVLKTNSEHKINNDMKSETRVNTENVVKISNDIENQTHNKPNNSNDGNNISLATTLPLDFFDNTDKVMTENSDAKNKDLISSSDTSLPKGFFDNPLLDAKARHVQYKDPVDEEYTKFQKMISEETNVSQNIIEVDMEAIQIDRTIIEIDEQITNWSKVNELQNKAQILHNSVKPNITKSYEDDSSEEEEDEELDVTVDWRNKRFLKS